MTPEEYLKNKKVLVMGLGFYGGGIASAKWLLSHNAIVTVTDLHTKDELTIPLRRFTSKEYNKITFVLGKHIESDFKKNDMIIVNPAIPSDSKFLKIAKDNNKDIQNDASLFFRFVDTPVIGITGTRGKTTSTNWIAQILSNYYGSIEPIGNSTKNPLLSEISKVKKDIPIVAELSSWQLELLPNSKKSPHIIAITNIYPDHLNRYKNIQTYANAKSSIFKHQKKSDILILNYDNDWHAYFLSKKPKSQIFFTSQNKLPKNMKGLYVQNNSVFFQKDGVTKKLISITGFEKKWGHHNVENLLISILSVILFNPSLKITKKIISNLKNIRFRQELVFENKHARFINDTTSTSPDALISAVRRFAGTNTYFIIGGTDKKLPFDDCAQVLKKETDAEHVIFLSGSATTNIIVSLKENNFFNNSDPIIYDSLRKCTEHAYESSTKIKKTIVLSPGASSFEKFNNEFHRGEMFELCIKEIT